MDIAPASTTAPPATAQDVRARLVATLRRDLVGPGPDDQDLAEEVLAEPPGRWYLTGFITPAQDGETIPDDPSEQEETELFVPPEEAADPQTGSARAEDDPADDPAVARRRFMPSSLGLTVLLPARVREVEVEASWGDYVTEPPLPPELLVASEGGEQRTTKEDRERAPTLLWRRVPGSAVMRLAVPEGRGPRIVLPGSAAAGFGGGALVLEAHARSYDLRQPDGSVESVRALTVVLVNRRNRPRRRYADLAYAFQARLELRCADGIHPRRDLSGYDADDADRRLADLQYKDVEEFAVGRNTSAGWKPDPDGTVRRAWTDPLPQHEVERVEPAPLRGVEWGMERLAELTAGGDAGPLRAALAALPDQYEAWIEGQAAAISAIKGPRRQQTAATLAERMRAACGRIAAGIELLGTDARARLAFRAMNEAVARAARQRNAGQGGDPTAVDPPKWRPFQLAFILLNLPGLADKRHDDREAVDLLFFPTGGGKTEAYLGLAAWAIAHRRLANGGVLGAGVAVLMRYTLRLLTLDQLARAAGVVCALELMRGEPAWRGPDGRPLLGDWPVEIGLWVGSAASPNKLGRKGGDIGPETAVGRIRRFRKDGKEAPAPLKACPWCATPFTRNSFACEPNETAPRHMAIRCTNDSCPFQGERHLPVVAVDEAIYRRLPAFLIATVDKFAGLPWLAEAGKFFGHVDRHDEWGFYGAPDAPGEGARLWGGACLEPPDLVIQDELHLISGPLGTVAGLYEAALDRLSARTVDGTRVRPKIVASTATVRRAERQIEALFDRKRTEVFPPPGPDRHDSFFARTVPADDGPGRLYVGVAAQGKGPKLVFLRALTTLLAAAKQAELLDGAAAADPFMTAVCYFNALRELGGARRIVEDEVRARLRTYGTDRHRIAPPDTPFADRSLREPTELTSRVSTDKVAAAKEALSKPGTAPDGVDVALATNMISVGLDITRLGLMLVQGQPKTAAEYIQATSRVGRDKPGLVLAVLNAHKPRDRMHYEGFRHFHACFYRAVEATSVTPWAARALDRALAAVIVAIARHLDPAMVAESAAATLARHPEVRAAVREALLARAPDEAVAGGRAALATELDELLDGWEAVAGEFTDMGDGFQYTKPAARALLHQPLDPALDNLINPVHRRFVAGRSMRDVEASSPVRVCGPSWEAVS